jgi:hypothetical protein
VVGWGGVGWAGVGSGVRRVLRVHRPRADAVVNGDKIHGLDTHSLTAVYTRTSGQLRAILLPVVSTCAVRAASCKDMLMMRVYEN